MKQNRHPRNKPGLSGQLSCDTRRKNIQWDIDSVFNKQCWET